MAEAPMSNPSPEHTICPRSAGRHDSEMASQSEQGGKRHGGVSTECGAGARCVGIDDLPDEIMVKILSHLSFSDLVDVVRKVSTRWKRLSEDFKLWSDKEYEIRFWTVDNSHCIRGGITDEEAVRTFCEVPNLRRVNARRAVKSRIVRALSSSCRQLTELHLHPSQKLSYSVLKNLVEKCSRIRSLSLPAGLLKSERCSEAVSRLVDLRVLVIHASLAGYVPSLRPLADGCPRLAEVDFRNTEVDLDDLQQFLKAKRHTLVSLRMKWAMVGEKCVTPLLAECADSLERLELYEFGTVGEAAKKAFPPLGELRNLREFATSICKKTPRGVAATAFETGKLQNLRRLDLRYGYGVDDAAVVAICEGCPALRELLLRDCDALSDAAFSRVHLLKHLEMLDVSYCTGLGGRLVPLLAALPRLRTLLLEELEFPNLQPGLARLPELATLRCLSLNYSVVTGVPFDQFPKLVSLRQLKLNGCRGDPNAIFGLMRIKGLKIEGNIESLELGSEVGFHDSDLELEEEENDEDGRLAAAAAAAAHYRRAEDGEAIGDAGWDESCISCLFMEDE